MKNCVHPGGSSGRVPWTNGTGAAVTAGSVVVMKHQIGIACVDIADGDTGSVAIDGVYSGLPKTTGHAFVQGEKLIWDVSAGKFDYSAATPATGDITGAVCAWVAAASGDTTCTVKLTPGNTTLT